MTREMGGTLRGHEIDWPVSRKDFTQVLLIQDSAADPSRLQILETLGGLDTFCLLRHFS